MVKIILNIAIIGGGAAGFFSAIAVKENYPDYNVTIFEKTNKLLAKVKISGGGRCNLTNACETIDEFVEAYPRGKRLMKKLMYRFSNKDTMHWFFTKGVPLVTQADNCVFPQSQNSGSIIGCFYEQVNKYKINIKLLHSIIEVSKKGDKICIKFDNIQSEYLFDKVIVAIGGSSKLESFQWLEKIGHTINKPVPSLFTFKTQKNTITNLQGIVIPDAICTIQSTNLVSKDAILITDWGFSGPAIIKLSSYGAGILSEMNYNFTIRINWSGIKDQEQVKNYMQKIKKDASTKQINNYRPYNFPMRFWSFLIEKANINPSKKWTEISQSELNKLTSTITNDIYQITARNKFKEEYVTCGGVNLSNINPNTLESKVFNNMYFAGEVLDIDGITGGYNLQAAWTTAFIAGMLK